VHFQKLRLSGFKSFVEAADLRIEPGLTGVVGPNGCGKSNLLEALRWVMGASSAKAMRGAGMDDVIFAGSGGRPARNHAEVALTIDNGAGAAPEQFARFPTLEVSRRIDRGAGSTYRVNGREVRARDVQLLFADASTGANSPALVRQGQISELISAKPQNRRLILEEAAGVAGLHSRRHEAQLKVHAAETNLTRLADLAAELESALGRLRREARQAARHQKISAQIHLLQGAALYGRWLEAKDILARADQEATVAAGAAEQAVRGAAKASAEAAAAEAVIRPLREEETTAAAILQRLTLEKDRLDREIEGAAAELERLKAEAARLEADASRESQVIEESGAAAARLDAENAEVEAAIAAAPETLPELASAAEAAESARREADGEVERLAAEAAADEARRRAAETREQEARTRLSRSQRALDQAKAELAALGPSDDPRRAEALAAQAEAEAALQAARQALEDGEAERALATEAEAAARKAARDLEDRLGALASEEKGLGKLVAQAPAADYPPALDLVTPAPGLEAALAAALGDDLNAALDPRAPAHWAGAQADPPAWPEGATPLGPLVKAPPQLAARLALIALVDGADAARLAPQLPAGARLVSREGDLWRWDGFTVTAKAARPAELRLRQRARLTEIRAEIEALTPKATAASKAAADAAGRLTALEAELRRLRSQPPQTEAALQAARRRLESLERENALREARAQSLQDTVARFEAERAELAGQLTEASSALEGLAQEGARLPALEAARAAAAAAREAETAARAALNVELKEREARGRRREALIADRSGWTSRSEAAERRRRQLSKDHEKTLAAIAASADAPARVEARRLELLDQLALAEARRAKSGDALAQGEAGRSEADRRWRAAEAEASQAREQRAALAARLEGARDRFGEAAGALREQTGREPDALGRRLAEEAPALLAEAAGAEGRLAALLREREQIGPVNLRAEAEAEELAGRLQILKDEEGDLKSALGKLRQSIAELNAEGRERLLAAFGVIDGHFRSLFTALFEGGQAELRLVESDDPLEAGLEIFACPPGKRLTVMSLLSGGEQALTAAALIFAVFLAHPAPICVLDEVDAPLDDANVERFCNLLDEMRRRSETRFIAITHNPLTMSRMDRLYGVTMPERGVSQLVSVDLRQAEALAAQ
jgi:chromosome segregation protein